MRSFFKRSKPTVGPTSGPIEEVPSQDTNQKEPSADNVEKTETSASGPSADQESQQPRTDYAGAALELSPAEKALVWKLDKRMMPISFILYFLNYLDRTSIGSAKLNGIEAQLRLVGQQLQKCIQILFVAYLIFQLPTNMAMSSQKWLKPAHFIGVFTLIWGVTSACTALTQNYTDLMIVRFVLGFGEAPFFPGIVYIMTLYYTRKEVATRVAICYSGNLFAQACSGPIAAFIFKHLDGARGLSGWRWLFIIYGTLTVIAGIAAAILLPHRPEDTKWLTPEERALVKERIERDTVDLTESIAGFKGQLKGAKEVIMDPKMYLFMFMQNAHMAACGWTNFFPTILKSLGRDTSTTLYFTFSPFIVAIAATILVAKSSGRFNETSLHICASFGIAMIGFILLTTVSTPAVRYTAVHFIAPGSYAVNALMYSWASATLGQTPEKKAVAMALVSISGNAAYLYTPFLYNKEDEPMYTKAMIWNIGFAAACMAAALGLRVWHMVQNRRMRKSDKEVKVFYIY